MSRTVRPLALAALLGIAGAVLVAAPGSSDATPRPEAAAPSYTPPPIDWGPCQGLGPRARCGKLVVPLDYARPNGTKIKIAVSRTKHTSPAADYQGVIVGNPGGPGGSGLGMAGLGDALPDDEVASQYDWIGLDPRGVGASRPALSCLPGYNGWRRPPYVPTSHALLDHWRARASHYADACASSDAAELLPHLTTADTVADIESLRIALGQDQISYYGFSYGTYIGEVYATLHPDRVRRMVWDGVIDPTHVWYQANLDQDVAFEKSVAHFWRWVARHHDSYHLGRTAGAVEDAYYRLLRRLARHPAGRVGPDEVTDVITNAAYYVYYWNFDAEALSDLVRHGRTGLMKSLYRAFTGIGDDNGYAMYLATECSEGAWPTDWATWKADARRLDADHPFLTWSNTWFNAPCLDWAAPTVPATDVDGSGLTTPILLVNETDDGATPYHGALAARALFPSASLVEGVGGSTHAGSLSGVGCVDKAVVRYLSTGHVPARGDGDGSDKQCPAVPPPPAHLPSGRVGPGTVPVRPGVLSGPAA